MDSKKLANKAQLTQSDGSKAEIVVQGESQKRCVQKIKEGAR